MDFAPTVAPFILRGVSLIGIDSVYAPTAVRKAAWQKLAKELPADMLGQIVSEIGLGDVIGTASALLKGTVKGRVVVNVNA
jgi:acrylyl-CoA reductase (NADPH)